MRLLPLIFVMLAGSLVAGEPTAYPLWDGQESVAEYAKRVSLPPTKTLELGGGVSMELVLIPAGKFVMGTPEPTPVDEEGFHKKIVTGQVLLSASGTALLVMLVVVIVRAVRKKQRPKFSLLWLLAMTVAAGGAVLSGVHWRQFSHGLEAAKIEYTAAQVRYRAANDIEKPAHPVTLAQPFYLGKFAVTQEQYQAVMVRNWSHFKGKNNPVEMVSWDDAQSFCMFAAEQTKQPVRLPTEAEWEYACRAGTTTTYYSGDADKDLCRVGWCEANSNGTTHPVGQKEPNAFGLYDMHGNVWQWCEDWYGHHYDGTPEAPAPDALRVMRGGSFYHGPRFCRSANRHGYAPDGSHLGIDTGFRVGLSPPLKTP